MATYTATRLTIDVTTHSVDTAIRAARAFLDEIESVGDAPVPIPYPHRFGQRARRHHRARARWYPLEPARGTYVIGREGALPVGAGTLADVKVPV